jgi:plasmid stabilization system protein ParE
VKLRFTPRARADIADIHQYIAQHNAAAATAVVRQIRSTSQLLARYPGLGRDEILTFRVFACFRPLATPTSSIIECQATN